MHSHDHSTRHTITAVIDGVTVFASVNAPTADAEQLAAVLDRAFNETLHATVRREGATISALDTTHTTTDHRSFRATSAWIPEVVSPTPASDFACDNLDREGWAAS